MPPKPAPKSQTAPKRTAPHSPTRERILAYLQENRAASVQSLSQAWDLTRADIRYHFKALLAEGVIERVPRRLDQPAPRGRPEQQYRLATGKLPDNFAALCAALLEALLGPLAAEDRQPALRSLAARLAGSFISLPNLTPRLNQASAFLSQHGYRARWEAHANGPRILLRSCPYAEILPDHPELCALDSFLIEHLVKLPVKQIAQMNLAGGHPAACIFACRAES